MKAVREGSRWTAEGTATRRAQAGPPRTSAAKIGTPPASKEARPTPKLTGKKRAAALNDAQARVPPAALCDPGRTEEEVPDQRRAAAASSDHAGNIGPGGSRSLARRANASTARSPPQRWSLVLVHPEHCRAKSIQGPQRCRCRQHLRVSGDGYRRSFLTSP